MKDITKIKHDALEHILQDASLMTRTKIDAKDLIGSAGHIIDCARSIIRCGDELISAYYDEYTNIKNYCKKDNFYKWEHWFENSAKSAMRQIITDIGDDTVDKILKIDIDKVLEASTTDIVKSYDDISANFKTNIFEKMIDANDKTLAFGVKMLDCVLAVKQDKVAVPVESLQIIQTYAYIMMNKLAESFSSITLHLDETSHVIHTLINSNTANILEVLKQFISLVMLIYKNIMFLSRVEKI